MPGEITPDDAIERTARARRTNAERTATTRAKILDATAQLLAEVGYARTSTNEVARRADVSRGALLHHFPTKLDLIVATLEHLIELRVDEFRVLVATAPVGADRFETAIDLLWSIFQGPTFDAWFEVTAAARTDEELAPIMASMHEQLRSAVQANWHELFPLAASTNDATPSFYDVIPAFLFAVLDGLAQTRFIPSDAIQRDTQDVLWLMHQLAALLPALTGAPQPGVALTEIVNAPVAPPVPPDRRDQRDAPDSKESS